MWNNLLYHRIYLSKSFKKYKTGVIFLISLAAIILIYLILRGGWYLIWGNQIFAKNVIDFAPEAWLGLLGLVLGTLIIVISVASQSTPKLIDLYTGDKTSLFYVWYIVIGAVHNMFLQLLDQYQDTEISFQMLFNTYLMLPVSLMLAVPYVLYILRYTKTSNVIEKISDNNLERIHRLQDRARLSLLNVPETIAEYQFELFESLNQMDDLLEYVSFKEPKGDIINKISLSIQTYIAIKKDLRVYAPEFFKISNRIGNDVSFKTMTGQFKEMEKDGIFYEQKGFRLLGNAYIKLIDNDDFDLASLCAYELSECGRKAIEYQDGNLIEVVMIRFNTLIRFGIKHGLKNQEARNLYNAIFHYSGFIHHIIKSANHELIKTSCTHLNRYVNEIYRHSRKEGSFTFLVDAFTWEFKRILIELSRNEIDINLQKEILGLFLKIDNLADAYEDRPVQERKFSTGVRGLQIALALYYIRFGHDSLAESIVIDILSDHEYMEPEVLKEAVRNTCNNLANAGENFWEDTDRGNSNLYYSQDTAYIDDFLAMFDTMLNDFSKLAKHSRSSTSS